MAENDTIAAPSRKLWMRLLMMVLLAFAFQLAASVLFVMAVAQLVLAAATGAPNDRLKHLGRSLGDYLGKIARFESFASDDLPFPFSAWPESREQINL